MHNSNRSGRFGGTSRAGRRNRRSRKDAEGNRLLKIAAAIAMPLLVLGGGGYGLSEYIKLPKINADYCYGQANQAQAAVFLDYSVNRNLSGAQRRDLVTALERSYVQLPPNGRVMIFTTALDSGASLAKPVFQLCRPAENAAEQEAIGAPEKTAPNLRRIAAEAQDIYAAQIDRILNETQDDAKAAQESPILEQIQAISRYPGFQGRRRSFQWLSDGIQNSEIARFGAVKGDMPPVASFIKRRDYDVIKPDSLAGVAVTLLLVESIRLPQPGLDFVTHDEMRRWWPAYFRANGAASVRLERLRPVSGS